MSVEPKNALLADPIRNFSKNLDGLREFLDVVKTFLEKESEDFQKARATDLIPLVIAMSETGDVPTVRLDGEEKKKLLEAFGGAVDIVKRDDGGVQIKVPGSASKRFSDAMSGLSVKKGHEQLLSRNCLITLISSAEWFLSQVLSSFFQAHPEAAGVKDKTLSLEELRKIGSVQEAESYLISLRVDEIMWGGFEDWMKFLRNTVKLSMGYLTDDESTLIEVFQRRNVMVHNNGIVHPSYIAKVDEKLRPSIKAGE